MLISFQKQKSWVPILPAASPQFAAKSGKDAWLRAAARTGLSRGRLHPGVCRFSGSPCPGVNSLFDCCSMFAVACSPAFRPPRPRRAPEAGGLSVTARPARPGPARTAGGPFSALNARTALEVRPSSSVLKRQQAAGPAGGARGFPEVLPGFVRMRPASSIETRPATAVAQLVRATDP